MLHSDLQEGSVILIFSVRESGKFQGKISVLIFQGKFQGKNNLDM